MADWSKLVLCTWMLLEVLCVLSHKVTVKDSELMLCDKDKRACVTEPLDCSPRSPSPIEKSLNMSCYYYMSTIDSVTCEWSERSDSHIESDRVSLIFRSDAENISCQGLFNPLAVLNVTVRMRDYKTRHRITSQPHTMVFTDAVKPPQPALTLLSSSADSIQVSWRSSSCSICHLRYRENHTPEWSQVSDSIPARQDQTLTFLITDLLPFTVYSVAAACKSGVWSDWSADVTVRTRDRVPSRPPEVCYRLENPDSFLLLMQKDLDLNEAGGRILGYQVMYKQQHLQDGVIQNITEGTAPLAVETGNCSVTVRAFNTAGYGPAAHLSIDTSSQITLPTVRNLWVSSPYPLSKSFLVQWENPEAPPTAAPITHFAVQWFPEAQPSRRRCTRVDSSSSSTIIHVSTDAAVNESYLVSVFPVHQHQCGPPKSLSASLQGALMEVVGLRVVGVTQTTVTAQWEWRRKSKNPVQNYTAELRTGSETQNNIPALSLWPDMSQHTFLKLKPDTQYSLSLLAGNVRKDTIPVRTDSDQLTAVATTTPLLLLAATVFIISVLSRTVWKSYFFPPISSPRWSTTGQWLMDPKQQKTGEINILDIENFQVTDILGKKSLILVDPDPPSVSGEDLSEDACPTTLWPITITAQSGLKLDSEYVTDAAVITDCHKPQETHGCFTQKEEVGLSEKSYQKQTAMGSYISEFMANTDSTRYMVNYTEDHAGVQNSDYSYLICETAYIANNLPVRTDPSVLHETH